jgi:hypothetical protein
MSARTIAIGCALAVLGLAAAVGIGLAANAISDDSVGLSAQPLSAGDSLAPKAKQPARKRPKRTETETETTTTSSTTTTAPPAPTATDDHGGDRGPDNSGPGSNDSGRGGDDRSGHDD